MKGGERVNELGEISALVKEYISPAAAICLNQLIKQHGRAGALKKGFDGKEEEDETGN